MKLETFVLTTDLRLHHRGGLGPEGVVEGNGVAEHTAGVPTAAVLLPFTHRQVWRGGRTRVTRGPERLGENGRATKKRTREAPNLWMKRKECESEERESMHAPLHKERKKGRKKGRPQLELQNVPEWAGPPTSSLTASLSSQLHRETLKYTTNESKGNSECQFIKHYNFTTVYNVHSSYFCVVFIFISCTQPVHTYSYTFIPCTL